jgi:hypothetical protein
MKRRDTRVSHGARAKYILHWRVRERMRIRFVHFRATRARAIVMPVHASNKPNFRFVDNASRISIDLINVIYWYLIVFLEMSSRCRSIIVITLAIINRQWWHKDVPLKKCSNSSNFSQLSVKLFLATAIIVSRVSFVEYQSADRRLFRNEWSHETRSFQQSFPVSDPASWSLV